MSSPDGGEDFVGVGGPGERFAVLVVFYEIALMAAWRSTTE
jgi:hypothetical protein